MEAKKKVFSVILKNTWINCIIDQQYRIKENLH